MILGATFEQEQAVRDLFGPGHIKQHTKPPDEAGYVKTKVWGPHGSSCWYWIDRTGKVTRGRP
jgi:hypothetical protein